MTNNNYSSHECCYRIICTPYLSISSGVLCKSYTQKIGNIIQFLFVCCLRATMHQTEYMLKISRVTELKFKTSEWESGLRHLGPSVNT